MALRKLNLHSNSIQGAIPSSLSTISSLWGLYLNRNNFSGSIPPGLVNSPLLQSLDLSHNQLSGSIPPLITNTSNSSFLSKLYFIDLSYNNLSMSIPGSSFSSLSALLELHLSHNSLQGPIPGQLGQLPSLSLLDLSHNQLNSSFPLQLANPSSNFSSLDLSFNQLTGPPPPQIGNLTQLKLLDLSNDCFSSIILPQLGNITGLQTLDLSKNIFNGSLPSSLALLRNLTSFNCSFNKLTGAVPDLVHRFNVSSFEGNAGLYGYNAYVTCAFPSAPPISSSPGGIPNLAGGERKHRFSTTTSLIIVIGSMVAGILLLYLISAVVCIFCRRTPDGPSQVSAATASVDKSSIQLSGGGKDGAEVGGGKIVHFDGKFTFTTDRLLCATAEVMCKSTYGTVYKAMFEDGNEVAMKQLREGIVKSQRDFETEVNMMGKVRHPSLLALRGYWGPKVKKLLISDFMAGGSLAAFLHARGPKTPRSWHTCLNITAGVARGLAHLHNNNRIINGNLTSSNILLDSRMNAKLSDFGLSRLMMTTVANANVIATASALDYRAPGLTKLRKATTKSDVYSFSIVLLELLTGKFPGEMTSAEQTTGMDLREWVASIVKEEWTNEIFDLEIMKGAASSEDELINTLQLA